MKDAAAGFRLRRKARLTPIAPKTAFAPLQTLVIKHSICLFSLARPGSADWLTRRIAWVTHDSSPGPTAH